MKVITYINSIAVKFIALDEFLPERISAMSPFSQAIAIRYSFTGQQASEVSAAAGIITPVFTNGVFDFEGKPIPVMSLEFGPQRITSVCSTSEQAAALIKDVVDFLVKDFGFRVPTRDIRMFVSSSLVVDFGPQFLEKITTVSLILDAMVRAIRDGGLKVEMFVNGLRYNGSAEIAPGANVGVHYAIEERANRPPGTSWLFSQAPLGTVEHELFLSKLESIVCGQ